jgi:hypothetical protein
MAVTPGWKVRVVLSAKDLNPKTVKLFRYMIHVKTTTTSASSKAKTTT